LYNLFHYYTPTHNQVAVPLIKLWSCWLMHTLAVQYNMINHALDKRA